MRASFWFLPCVIVALAIALAVTLTHLDGSALEQWMKRYPRLFGASAAGGREMLSTVAGSMISVVGIVFSMTLVALALASSQYSSRVLRTFMRSRVTQASIGIFAGIFVYCLIVLRGVHGTDDSVFVPVLAVSVAMLLAIVGVVVLIVFIHHIALSIQASTILANIAEETIDAMASIFPQMDDPSLANQSQADAAAAALVETLCWIAVPAPKSGYLQSVDHAALLHIACEGKLIVRVERDVGQFVLADTPIFSVSGESASARTACALHATIAVSPYRTVEQDPAFGVRQLVDVALKALSPGVNDTTTAVQCLDYIGAVMATMARRAIPSPYRYAEGELKIVVVAPDFASMLAAAFDQIRRSAGGNVAVILRMIASIDMLGSLAVGKGRQEDLLAQLDYLAEISARTVPAPHDSALVARRLAPVRRALAAGCVRRSQAAPPSLRCES
ncbi:DUF2254 domain-containing protein [Massilia psychrophila]|nr:DUF2254 domain-containing protein [Massilia psychrophila]GGE92835.1 hypothetical protein GCM10008020_42330 [Massilia psychrophila]